MTNLAIARILREIADLLELKNENPFKIRAYRNGADIVANHPHDLGTLDEPALREIPGIGKDLAARIREMATTGDASIHRDLLAEFPPTVLDLLQLHGVGPKTVAMLYTILHVRSVDDLERAAAEGRVRALRGMGVKKEAQILQALADRKRRAGRHLLPAVDDACRGVAAALRARVPEAEIAGAGSLRRGRETCGNLDLLAWRGAPSTAGPPSATSLPSVSASLQDELNRYRLTERMLPGAESTATVTARVVVQGGLTVALRIVGAAHRGAALQHYTGSTAHNLALRSRAAERGFTLSEEGLIRRVDGVRIAAEREEEIYHALDLEWIPPELREAAGEIDAAASQRLPRLIARGDLIGDLHVHTTESDGKDDLDTMADAARQAGLQYLAITEHSRSLAMANGLDERRALEHAARIRARDGAGGGVRLLAGIECDIRPDGALDLADDCLASLDLVIASVHSAFNLDPQQQTDRLLRALENPYVDILGHPTGRRLLRREPYALDIEAVIAAAARHGVALEINCHADRLDLSDAHARLARERGARLVISSDGHSRRSFESLRWGTLVARRAWLAPEDVLNTRPLAELSASLRRNRKGSTGRTRGLA